MIMDEKKIEEAAEDIFEDKFLGNGEEIIFTNDEGCEDYREEMYHDGQIKEAISLGAHWAIQEFLKDLWHDASEVPENRALLVELKIGKYIISMYSQEVKLFCKKWCYLSDILPKQKGGSK